MKTKTIGIRWATRSDFFDMVTVELRSSDSPWDWDDFRLALRERNCIGFVTTVGHDVAGFMVLELHSDHVHLVRFAVDPSFRRTRVGTAMLDRMKGKLSHNRRRAIETIVRESNLDGQLFFRSQGFRAACVLRRHFDTDEDGYLMQYRLPVANDAVFVSPNRFSNST